ncbi:MAG TPA: hypothetical protein DDX98_15315, partial [Bacteroidales bacterium]|nr:hypothetical protein [Bacteroidales bacterium]
KSLFENKELWDNYDKGGEIKKKLPFIFSKIPYDVQSILDVGCGNGEITNNFPEKYEVTGVDNSKEALEFVTKEKILCSADSIKVEDRSYDMVFSSELIEHLPSDIMRGSMMEFKRIARKYLFISVPNDEQLEKCLVFCPNCKTKFHAYGHLHAFTPKYLKELVGDDFVLIWHDTLGKKVKRYNDLLLKLRHRIAKIYFAPNEYTVCPNCNHKSFDPIKGNMLSKLFNGLNLIIPKKAKKYWLMVLFERK